MGYYYQKAKSVKDLNEEQLARYHELRSSENGSTPPELLERGEVMKNHIGPIFNGETMSAYEELVQDAVVTWILADEDPSKVEWSNPTDLYIPEPEPTEEEKLASAQSWKEFWEGADERRRLRNEELYGVQGSDPPKLPLSERIKNFFGWF